MDAYTSYATLVRPEWAPPAWLFGPVWTVLYVIIAITFGRVALMTLRREIPLIVALPFALNLLFNLSFTWIQFGLRDNLLAAADVLLTLATLIWAMVAIYPRARWIAYANIPYLAWVAFATVLQLTVTFLNI